VLKDISSEECWAHYEKYINKLREKVFSGGTVLRQRRARIFFETLLLMSTTTMAGVMTKGVTKTKGNVAQRHTVPQSCNQSGV